MTAHLSIHVRPAARATAVRGWRGGDLLHLEVSAPPEGGKANLAVAALIAETLGVPRSSVAVVRGGTARRKRVAIEGLDDLEVRRRIDAALEREGGTRGE